RPPRPRAAQLAPLAGPRRGQGRDVRLHQEADGDGSESGTLVSVPSTGRSEMTVCLRLVLPSLLAVAVVGCAKKEAPPPAPPDVKAAVVLQKDVPIYVEAIGQTRGSPEMGCRARAEGFVETIDLKEANPVRKGQLLYTIDPSQYQATLAQTK